MPETIGEIPMDDIRLLDDAHQKKVRELEIKYQEDLNKLLVRRGMREKDFKDKYILLKPSKNYGVLDVVIFEEGEITT